VGVDDVADIEDISAEWLSGVLGTEVRAVTSEPIGTGQTGATYRLALDAAPDLPPVLIAKVAGGDDEARSRVAPGYRNEVGFYEHLLSTLDVSTPRCWHAAISDDGLRFTLLLEDLSPRVPGVQADGCPADRAEAAVRNLAGLHAPRWNDPALHDLDFISGFTPDTADFTGEITVTAAEQFVDRYRQDLSAADAATLTASAAAVKDWLRAGQEQFAVLHGDYRLDNLMFGVAADDVVAVDWQTLSIGPPVRDVAYFLGTSVAEDTRRATEEALVAAYHGDLLERGVTGYDADRCFDDYRLGQLQGPLITMLGAIFATAVRSDAADRMFMAMARRSCAAIRDLGSLDLL
jgi:fructosamine-3-kinase